MSPEPDWEHFQHLKRQNQALQKENTRLVLENRKLKQKGGSMAIENKYGDVHVEGIPAGEPIFIFRAQDCFAGIMLRLYQIMVRAAGRKEMAEKINLAIARFDAWDVKKIPD